MHFLLRTHFALFQSFSYLAGWQNLIKNAFLQLSSSALWDAFTAENLRFMDSRFDNDARFNFWFRERCLRWNKVDLIIASTWFLTCLCNVPLKHSLLLKLFPLTLSKKKFFTPTYHHTGKEINTNLNKYFCYVRRWRCRLLVSSRISSWKWSESERNDALNSNFVLSQTNSRKLTS